MSLRLVITRIFYQGRATLQKAYKGSRLSNPGNDFSFRVAEAVTAPVKRHNKGIRHLQRRNNAPSIFANRVRTRVIEVLKPRVANSLAVELKKKLANARGPVLALVGVMTAESLVTKQDQMESVCCEIRSVMKKRKSGVSESEFKEDDDINLEQFEFGPLLAKGSNAVVYAARWKDEQTTDNDFDLAVKMMFNFEAESMAPAIFRAMCKEIIPAQWINLKDMVTPLDDSFMCRPLPLHPNIVDMICAFADRVPDLPQNMLEYPDALPQRINPGGAGRNMSLFLVMKKYSMTVEEFLRRFDVSFRTRLLLLTQLLEAVTHMVKNQIAHRDLKVDNLLVDISDGVDTPLLVVTDFGCCRADRHQGLILPYTSVEVDRGGNSALMPPEVACAVPGSFSRIDYTKADLWTCGTIAYQIFGCPNPFYYNKDNMKRLDSRSYSDEDLPDFPGDVHEVVKQLVKSLLRRSTQLRSTASVSATVCQLLLWAPKAWTNVSNPESPTHAQVLDWLVTLATKVLCEQRAGCASQMEADLISTFLERVSLCDVLEALSFAAADCSQY